MLGLDTVLLTTLIAAATAVWLYRLVSNWLGFNYVTLLNAEDGVKAPWGW